MFNCGDHSSLDLVESISCACIHFDLEFDLLHGRDGMFMLEKVQGFASKDSASRNHQSSLLLEGLCFLSLNFVLEIKEKIVSTYTCS